MSPRPALTGLDHSIQTSFSGFWLVFAMETNTWHVLLLLLLLLCLFILSRKPNRQSVYSKGAY